MFINDRSLKSCNVWEVIVLSTFDCCCAEAALDGSDAGLVSWARRDKGMDLRCAPALDCGSS